MAPLFTRILLLVLLLSGAITYGHTGSLRGKVTDAATGRPVDAAGVFVKERDASTITDPFGMFFIKGIAIGNVTLLVTVPGYAVSEQTVNIEDGVTSEVVVQLTAREVTMKEVTVNAKKDLNLSSLSGIDLKLRPVNSSQDMLRLVPGLFTSQHQGGGKAEQLFLRGMDADHGTDVNISVDGMPVNMVSHAHGQGFADTHFIIPEAVQELDYGKGPYQADKGNLCTAGWVGFKTRNSLDNSFVKTDAGMYGYFRTVAGISLLSRAQTNNRQDAYIMTEYGYNNGYFSAPQQFQRFNIMGKYTNYLAPGKMLSLTLSGFGTTWDASGQIPSRAIDSGYLSRYGSLDGEGGFTSRYNANLQYYQQTAHNGYFKSNIWATYYQFRLYSDFTFYLLDPVNGDQIKQAESRVAGGSNNEYGTSYELAGMAMKTTAGIGLRYDVVTNDELSHTAGKQIVLDQIALGDVHETNIYAYVSQRVNLTKQLVFNAGARFDYIMQQYINRLPTESAVNTLTGNHACSPKAGLYYNFSDKARIYYNYGVGFHSNDTRTIAVGSTAGYQQLYGSSLPLHTLPLAFSQDLGFIAKPAEKLLLAAAFWRLDLQQEFTYSGDESNVSPAGATRRIGIDVSARYDLLKWLYLDADVNLARARFVDSAAGHNYLPLAAGFTASGGATFKLTREFTAGLRCRMMGDRPATEDNGIKAPGYTLLDAVFSYNRPTFELGVQVQNIMNVQWDEAAFATTTRLRQEVAANLPGTTDLCFTPGTPFFLKFSATYKF